VAAGNMAGDAALPPDATMLTAAMWNLDQTKILMRHELAVPIHHGRHTFISHTLTGGRTLAELRDARGTLPRAGQSIDRSRPPVR